MRLFTAFCGQQSRGSICQCFEINIPFFIPGQTPPRWWCASDYVTHILLMLLWSCVCESVCAYVCLKVTTLAATTDLLWKNLCQSQDKSVCRGNLQAKKRTTFVMRAFSGSLEPEASQIWLQALLGRKHTPSLQTSYEGHSNHKYLGLLNASIYEKHRALC